MSPYTSNTGTAGLAPGQEKTDRGPQRRRRQRGGQLTAKVRDATGGGGGGLRPQETSKRSFKSGLLWDISIIT